MIKSGPFAAILLFDFDIIMLLKMHYKTMLRSAYNRKNAYCPLFDHSAQILFRHTSKDFSDSTRLREIAQERNLF